MLLPFDILCYFDGVRNSAPKRLLLQLSSSPALLPTLRCLSWHNDDPLEGDEGNGDEGEAVIRYGRDGQE